MAAKVLAFQLEHLVCVLRLTSLLFCRMIAGLSISKRIAKRIADSVAKPKRRSSERFMQQMAGASLGDEKVTRASHALALQH